MFNHFYLVLRFGVPIIQLIANQNQIKWMAKPGSKWRTFSAQILHQGYPIGSMYGMFTYMNGWVLW